MTLIKSISGIRGTIGGEQGDNLTPLDLVKFTSAYAAMIRSTTSGRAVVVLGRDARISGEMVSAIVEGTLCSCGVDVINVGLCTTPGVELAVTEKKADGGIILTASHNPKQWNALKLLNSKGEFLNDTEGKQILAAAESGAFEFVDIDSIGSVIERSSFDSHHIEMVMALPMVDKAAVAGAGFKVVVDAVNSVGGTVIPALLRELGVEVVEMYCTPNGHFPHNPEPLPENLTEISAAVLEHKADMGIVVDPDVDRLAFVCQDGTMFGEEYTLVAVADYILSKTKGATVSNLSSTRALRDVTSGYGCEYFSAAVGEVNVVARMKECGAVIGGEGNGGVIYPELHYGRDALVGVALFLSLLAHKKMSMSELRASYPSYYISKNKIELTDDIDVDKILLEMKEKYSAEQVTDIDGVKIDFADGWVHLRKSNTEAIIRIYSEKKDKPSADALAMQIINDIKSLI
ncbi:MAG: phosphoglucosamine mutase [Rikenellaceae bacterium]